MSILFQSLFYWMYVKNTLPSFLGKPCQMFQSLFYWMYVKNPKSTFPAHTPPTRFQSLFYWMYVKNVVVA